MAKQPPGNVDPGVTQEFVSDQASPRPAATPHSARKSGAQKTSVLGDFRLIARLGEGGMGTVFKARQISKPRDVALKVLSKELAARPAFVERFHREGRLMARLEHANVVRCYAFGEALGFHYLAMEFVAGGSVQTWLDKLGRFSAPDAVHIILACARALAHASGLGMIHRDIKPDNILLTTDGVPKLADLGLAKTADDTLDLTRTGIGIGTPLYAAPEQVRDAKHADMRSDLYALGCVLYHLVAGRPPFEGRNFLELIQAKEKGLYAPLRRAAPGCPEALDRLLTRLMVRLPEMRYPGYDELIADLTGQNLAGERLSFLET